MILELFKRFSQYLHTNVFQYFSSMPLVGIQESYRLVCLLFETFNCTTTDAVKLFIILSKPRQDYYVYRILLWNEPYLCLVHLAKCTLWVNRVCHHYIPAKLWFWQKTTTYKRNLGKLYFYIFYRFGIEVNSWESGWFYHKCVGFNHYFCLKYEFVSTCFQISKRGLKGLKNGWKYIKTQNQTTNWVHCDTESWSQKAITLLILYYIFMPTGKLTKDKSLRKKKPQ